MYCKSIQPTIINYAISFSKQRGSQYFKICKMDGKHLDIFLSYNKRSTCNVCTIDLVGIKHCNTGLLRSFAFCVACVNVMCLCNKLVYDLDICIFKYGNSKITP